MQQPCSRCGYISDRPARFCRQCGSQLAAETEASSANTRNYAPQQASPQYPDQQPAYPSYAPNQQWVNRQDPGQYWDEQTPSTTPFYRPPVAPQYQIPATEQKRTNWGKWVLIGLLTFMLICMAGVGGAIYLGKKWVRQHTESSADDGSAGAPNARTFPDQAPGVPPPPPPASSLESYKYPNAEVTESHKDGLNEMTQMNTDDDLEDVRDFYQEKFKNSSVSIKNENGQKFIFTSLGQPLITVIVQPDEKDDDKTQITLLRANIPIPKMSIPKIGIH